jgi:hypothetical protein
VIVEEVSFSYRETRTRFPFRYGIASMTELPHLFVRVRVTALGKTGEGLASEGLPPKWFTKDPGTTFAEDLPGLVRVIDVAARHALALPPQKDIFGWWRSLCEAQSAWAISERVPPLLAQLGTSLLERAVLDAFCRISGLSLAQAFAQDALGFRIGALHPHLPVEAQMQFFQAPPARETIVRHTVGLGDPLTAEGLSAEERIEDGLPLVLEDIIPRYGLTRFKIKLSGKLDQDKDRLGILAKILPALSPDYRVTLDGNEQFADVDSFREAWEALRAEPILQDLLGPVRLALVEQPLHRDRAMGAEVGEALRRWPGRPPMIIDESDSELGTVAEALELGYAGASHKNCKGVFKGIANGLLLDHRRAEGAVQTGEDLANIGPVALLQDCSVMALLRVPDVERNGHHYFRGLTPFPPELGGAMVGACPDLYERRPDGTVSLRIRQGRLDLGAVLQGPFGHTLAPATVLELAGVTSGLPGDLADSAE